MVEPHPKQMLLGNPLNKVKKRKNFSWTQAEASQAQLLAQNPISIGHPCRLKVSAARTLPLLLKIQEVQTSRLKDTGGPERIGSHYSQTLLCRDSCSCLLDKDS